MNNRALGAAIALFLAIAAAPSAQAAVTTWTLQDATFDDGGAITAPSTTTTPAS